MWRTLDREHLEKGAIELQGAALVAFCSWGGRGGEGKERWESVFSLEPWGLEGEESSLLQGAAACVHRCCFFMIAKSTNDMI